MFAMIQAAGWPVWFLLAASLVGLTLIVERVLYLRANRILPPMLLAEAITVSRAGRVDDEVILQLEQNSPLGCVLAAGMRQLAAPRDAMRLAVEEAGRVVAHRLQRYLTTLGTVATLAPLMGRDPSRTSFMPLEPFGLWLAVTMIPPSASRWKVWK